MLVILWAIFNLVLAIMTLFGSTGAATALAWSIVTGFVISVIVGIAKAS